MNQEVLCLVASLAICAAVAVLAYVQSRKHAAKMARFEELFRRGREKSSEASKLLDQAEALVRRAAMARSSGNLELALVLLDRSKTLADASILLNEEAKELFAQAREEL